MYIARGHVTMSPRAHILTVPLDQICERYIGRHSTINDLETIKNNNNTFTYMYES